MCVERGGRRGSAQTLIATARGSPHERPDAWLSRSSRPPPRGRRAPVHAVAFTGGAAIVPAGTRD